MEWPTAFVILGLLAFVGIIIVGGRARVSKDAIEIDTKGLLAWIHKARTSKGIPEAENDRELSGVVRISSLAKSLPRATVLWVDDHPINNLFERRALSYAGVFCDSYASNDEAVEALRAGSYDLIISDIGRDHDNETGWDLLDRVRSTNESVPFVFYTMGINDRMRQDARNRGANGIVETPDDLVKLVFGLLRGITLEPTRGVSK